jgi:hypothetical protein
MRRDERRRADDVAQPLTEFAQFRGVLDSMKTARNGVITAPVTAIFATPSGSSPLSLT